MVAIDKLLSLGSRSARFVGSTRKHRIISASALFLALCAFGAAGVAPLAPDASDLPVQSIIQELELPTLAEQVARLTPSAQTFINEERVRPATRLPHCCSASASPTTTPPHSSRPIPLPTACCS